MFALRQTDSSLDDYQLQDDKLEWENYLRLATSSILLMIFSEKLFDETTSIAHFLHLQNFFVILENHFEDKILICSDPR